MAMLARSALLFGSLLLAEAVSASKPQELPASLKACGAIASDAERLACYDREMAALTAATAPASAPAAAPTAKAPAAVAATAPAAAAASQAEFGTNPELARAQRKKEKSAEDPKPEQISARVSELQVPKTGEFVVKLDNGQVWRRIEGGPFSLEVGDAVTIRSGMLGSFWLVAADSQRTRVKRVR